MLATNKSCAGPSESDEDYVARLTDVVCKSFTVPLISYGIKLGLYDALERINEPTTFTNLAKEAKLKPRYVEEWCRGLVMAEVMTYNPDTQKFHISVNRLKSLRTIAIMAQFSTDTVNTRKALMEAMREDGPPGFVPWEEGNFSDRMQMQRDQWVAIPDAVSKFVDLIPDMTKQLESGIEVCEVGSNYGSTLIKMAQLYPRSNFTGLDICEEVCVEAQKRAEKLSLTNITFQAQDLFNFPVELHNRYDYVTVFDVVHDVGDPPGAVRCIHQIVKPGGYFSLVDVRIHSDLKDNIGDPLVSWIYPVSMSYCLGNSMHDGGDGAGAGYGMENITRDLKQAGFSIIAMEPLPYVAVLNHTVGKKSSA